jgi:hypothetical protein
MTDTTQVAKLRNIETSALRAEFEKEFGAMMELAFDDLEWQPERNCYAHLPVHWAWKGFQAAHSIRNAEVERLKADAERYQRAISSYDNAEELFSAVLMHRSKGPAFVNAAFDAALSVAGDPAPALGGGDEEKP